MACTWERIIWSKPVRSISVMRAKIRWMRTYFCACKDSSKLMTSFWLRKIHWPLLHRPPLLQIMAPDIVGDEITALNSAQYCNELKSLNTYFNFKLMVWCAFFKRKIFSHSILLFYYEINIIWSAFLVYEHLGFRCVIF